MKIKSMTAVFGRLDRATLELGPGLNLIEAPNEGGKSTWAAFWRAMLYGIDTRERDKKGALADKNRWQPWSGAPMAGELTLEWEGRDITIRRGPRGTVPFGAFSAVYTGTQEPVAGLTAANCGELLAGVGQEVFTRSAFLGNGNMTVTAVPELERRIAALVTTGQEDVSFSQAMERLKEWKNRRQVNRSVGEIPKLEGELSQAEEALTQLEETARQAARLEEEYAALVRRRDGLEQQQEARRQTARLELSQRQARAEADCRAARQQLEELETAQTLHPIPSREDLKGAQGELQYLKVLKEEIRQGGEALKKAEEEAAQASAAARDELFPDMSGEEAVSQAEEEAASWQTAARTSRRAGRQGWLCLGLAVLAAAGWGAGEQFLNLTAPILYGLIGAAALLLVLGLWSFGRARRKRGLKQRLSERYGVQTPEEFAALAQDYQARCQAAEQAAHRVEVIRNAVVEREVKRDSAKVQLLDFVHRFAPEVRDLFGCSAALSRALNMDHDLALARERVQERRRRLDDLAGTGVLPLSVQDEEEAAQELAGVTARLEQVSARLNRARGSLTAMGDPAALSARREQLADQLARRRTELEAIQLAAQALTQANTRLQERFSPALNALAGQYLARLTGNRYQAVTLTRELEGFVRPEGDVIPRSALCLSRGTADQLYLALRLAVCRLCLPDRPPIVLDDALAAFDDHRLALALGLLYELAGEQQILLFTCQKREGEVLSRVPGVTRLALS